MPYEKASGLEHTGELVDHSDVVSRIGKEPERSEEVDDRVESAAPSRRHAAHISASVLELRSSPSPPRGPEQMLGVVETVYTIPCLGKKM